MRSGGRTPRAPARQQTPQEIAATAGYAEWRARVERPPTAKSPPLYRPPATLSDTKWETKPQPRTRTTQRERSDSPRGQFDELMDQLRRDPELYSELKQRGSITPDIERIVATPREVRAAVTIHTEDAEYSKLALVDSGATDNFVTIEAQGLPYLPVMTTVCEE